MQIQQLSVFIENKPGRMAEVTEVLAEANIDIRAISVADTRDFGILRVIVDKPKEAVEALKAHGMTVTLTKVIAVGIDDKPGAFSKAVRLLSNEGFDVEYMYAFISRDKGKAYVIITPTALKSCPPMPSTACKPPNLKAAQHKRRGLFRALSFLRHPFAPGAYPVARGQGQGACPQQEKEGVIDFGR